MASSVLILSGGLDSSVSAALSREHYAPRQALFFDYGQRAAVPERQAATAVARFLNVPLQTIKLPWLAELGGNALTEMTHTLPELATTELDDEARTAASARAVWVPNRNGVFLNIGAAFAESIEADVLITGFNAEEAATFPDNTQEFVEIADEFFRFATATAVRVESLTQKMNKSEIVAAGLKSDMPLEHLWSCYAAGDKMCGRCESCRRSMRAYREAGLWKRMESCFAN